MAPSFCPKTTEPIHDQNSEPDITREVDRNLAGSITESIVTHLAEADVVVADITGRNPNVFLELGIRYALRNKVTVVMADIGSMPPFDISSYRYIPYSCFKPEIAKRKIAEFVREGLMGQGKSDSLVFDIFKEMSVFIPGVAESHGPSAGKFAQAMQ